MKTESSAQNAAQLQPNMNLDATFNFLQLDIGGFAHSTYALEMHTALTKMLSMLFVDSELDLNHENSAALSKLTTFMVDLKSKSESGLNNQEPFNNFLRINTGDELPETYALSAHYSILCILRTVLSHPQLDFDKADIRVLWRIIDLSTILVYNTKEALWM